MAEEKHKQAYNDYKNGMSNKEIAEKYSVSESTVRSWRNRYWKALQRDGENVATSVATEEKTLQRLDKISWVDIEQEYISDMSGKPCTLQDLADKYGISYYTITHRSKNHDWIEKRKRFTNETLAKAVEKTVEAVSTDLAKINQKHIEVSDKLLGIMEQSMNDDKQFFRHVDEFSREKILKTLNTKRFSEMTKSLKDLQNIQLKAVEKDEVQENSAVSEWLESILDEEDGSPDPS